MRTTPNSRLIAITAVCLGASLAAGCGETDVCAAAAAHVNTCFGEEVWDAGASCDPSLAEQLLAIPCEDLALGADRDKGTELCADQGDRCLPLDISHPGYWLDATNEVAIGGRFVPLLDKQWYREKAALAASYGVDPYYWMAFSLEEYGGYRLGPDHTATSEDRGLAHLAVGRKFVQENGAAGILVGDVIYSGFIFQAAIQSKLKQAGVPKQDAIGFNGEEFSAYFCHQQTSVCTQDVLDRQSFIMLKAFQDKVLKDEKRVYWWENDTREGYEGKKRLRYRARTTDEPTSVGYGMQGVHGYGNLPYLYRSGEYGEGTLVRYVASTQTLVPAYAGNSGITGANHPIYGMTLLHYINVFAADERFDDLIPADAATPIKTRVLESVATGSGLYGVQPESAPTDD
ncbi:MAG: hypothetical protein IPL79_08380 [Myxococcales bacterium]|nr:hypothetical protein [Myxococcales bacterium]